MVILVVKHAREEHKAAVEWLNIQYSSIEYWQAFNDYAFQRTEFAKAFYKRKPITDHWMDFSIGSSACHIAVIQIQKRNAIGVELYINDDKELFKNLLTHKDEVESVMGFGLDWRELPERKASRINRKEGKFGLRIKMCEGIILLIVLLGGTEFERKI